MRALQNHGSAGCLLMIVLLALLLAGIAVFAREPSPDVVREHCDVLERNEVWTYCEADDTYSLCFAQLLFRNWDEQRGTHEIDAWRITRSSGETKDRIGLLHSGGSVTACWWDGDRLRIVEAGSYWETSADFDREVAERNQLPERYRRNLR